MSLKIYFKWLNSWSFMLLARCKNPIFRIKGFTPDDQFPNSLIRPLWELSRTLSFLLPDPFLSVPNIELLLRKPFGPTRTNQLWAKASEGRILYRWFFVRHFFKISFASNDKCWSLGLVKISRFLLSTLWKISYELFPGNGSLPVRQTNITMPTDHTSLDKVICPLITSGEM